MVRGVPYLLLIIDVMMPGNGTFLWGRLTAAAIHVAPLVEGNRRQRDSPNWRRFFVAELTRSRQIKSRII